MAIGDFNSNGNGNNSQGSKDVTYYSRLKFRSKDNSQSLSISFWGGLLIFQIDAVDTSNGFKSTPVETIRLSIAKAKLLSYELEEYSDIFRNRDIKKDPNVAYGVNAGLGSEQSYIGFIADEDNEGVVTTGVVIGKIDGQGTILSSHTVMFDASNDFYNALEWEDITKMKVSSVSFGHIEIEMIQDLVKDFASHMNGAIAYSVQDINRYEYNKMNRKFDSIFDKLGIERIQQGSGRGNYGRTNSFLNNLASKNSSSVSFDNLEDMLE